MNRPKYARILLRGRPNTLVVKAPAYERREEYRPISVQEAKDIARLYAPCQREEGYVLAVSKKGVGTVCVSASSADEVITKARKTIDEFYRKKQYRYVGSRIAVMNFIPTPGQANRLDRMDVHVLFLYRDQQDLPPPNGDGLAAETLKDFWLGLTNSSERNIRAMVLQNHPKLSAGR